MKYISVHSSYNVDFFNNIRKVFPNLLIIQRGHHYELSNGTKTVTVSFGIEGFHIDSAHELVCERLCSDKYFHLKGRMSSSIIKETERGTRRYFPLIAKKYKLSKLALKEAYTIIFGSRPEDDIAISNAILYNGLADYIEEFDDKLWVRTIAL